MFCELEWTRKYVVNWFCRLVDELTFSRAANAPDAPTATAILGPFFRDDAPIYPNGASIIKNMPKDGEVVYMHGKVVDSVTGEGIEGVMIDVWEASTNGLYEQQDPEQDDCNLRGRFRTDKDGNYSLYCLRPVPYPIPYDGMSSSAPLGPTRMLIVSR